MGLNVSWDDALVAWETLPPGVPAQEVIRGRALDLVHGHFQTVYDLPAGQGERGLLLHRAGVHEDEAPVWVGVPDDDLLVLIAMRPDQ